MGEKDVEKFDGTRMNLVAEVGNQLPNGESAKRSGIKTEN